VHHLACELPSGIRHRKGHAVSSEIGPGIGAGGQVRIERRRISRQHDAAPPIAAATASFDDDASA
jgi:hypothetical protein